MAQFRHRHFVFNVKDDASVPAELELTSIHFFEGVNQCCLAMKKQGVLSFLRFYLIDSYQATTLGLRREVAGLPPF